MTSSNWMRVLLIGIGMVPASVIAQIASGGSYALDQAVVAGGGGARNGSIYAVEDTVGQHAAGVKAASSPYAQAAGFWTPPALAPTAAGVRVGGRALTPDGMGIRGARIMISGSQLPSPRTAISSSFGYFAFEDIPVGHTYLLTITHTRYTFTQQSIVVTLVDTRDDIIFETNPFD